MAATISECGQYRYLLTRNTSITGDTGQTVFVMLNPSTADAVQDDPTIRRCLGFADAWGSSGLIVANLYALRSPDPSALWQHDDPIGPENDAILADLARQHQDIVCAWGANAPNDRVRTFLDIANGAGGELWCLERTKSGAPRHPLYVRRDAQPQRWALLTGR